MVAPPHPHEKSQNRLGDFLCHWGWEKAPFSHEKKAIFEEKPKKSHFSRKKFAKTLASSKIMRTFATEIENNLTP